MKILYENEYKVVIEFDSGIMEIDKVTGKMISWEGFGTI